MSNTSEATAGHTAGFTPGPWVTGARMTSVQVWPKAWNAALIIADCDAQHAPDSEGERVANARLIAASPMLLEALRESVRHYADILDNCLFPAHGFPATLTPEHAAWRAKVKGWKEQVKAAIQV